MTDQDVVERAASMMGAKKVVPRGPYGDSKQVQFWSVVYGRNAEETMLAIRPYMGQQRGAKIDSLLSLDNLSHRKVGP
jgi:hypothetical protein